MISLSTTRRRWFAAYLMTLCLMLGACDKAPRLAKVDPGERDAGGLATTSQQDANAFSMPSANLTPSRRMDFFVGNAFFRTPWVPARDDGQPAPRSGAGPLLNTDSCQSCHIKDGRGHPPAEGRTEPALSTLVRLSIPNALGDIHSLTRLGVIPEPTYGGQLQDNAIPGHAPEGRIRLEYDEHREVLADGTEIGLRKPRIRIEQLGYGPLHPQTLTSMRVAPPMIGLGLLEAIDESDLRENVARQARDGEVSGRLNQVWSYAQNKTVIGRFGWKAGEPSLDQQNASAFSGDMGLTNALFDNDDCTVKQPTCRTAPQGGALEVTRDVLDAVLFYSRHLAVPARRDHDKPEVLRGKALFNDIGCAACHRPSYRTGTAHDPELSDQLIYPYTDLLLHDMGEGLADGRPEYLANGREWRTPPLWGLGLTQTVSGHTQFLHDGRARNLLEAILWHGGEAQAARERVKALPTEDREALLRFLDSL